MSYKCTKYEGEELNQPTTARHCLSNFYRQGKEHGKCRFDNFDNFHMLIILLESRIYNKRMWQLFLINLSLQLLLQL